MLTPRPSRVIRLARRVFSTRSDRIEPLHSALLTLPASSLAGGSDHGRLNMALRLIDRKGRLYVSLVGDYDAGDSGLKTVLSRYQQVYHQSALLRPDVDVRILLPDERTAAAAASASAAASTSAAGSSSVGHGAGARGAAASTAGSSATASARFFFLGGAFFAAGFGAMMVGVRRAGGQSTRGTACARG